MTDITALAQRMDEVDPRDAFEKLFPLPVFCIRCGTGYASTSFNGWDANKHQDRWEGWKAAMALMESRTVTAAERLFRLTGRPGESISRQSDEEFPQPNYVLLKVAEEAGEVVQAGVHYAEKRMEWKQVESEIVQLLAMLIRLVTEGDQINGVTPPASCAADIQVIEGDA